MKWKCLEIEIEKWNFSRNSWEPDSMQNHQTFLHHVFSNVSSNCLPKMMQITLVAFVWLFPLYVLNVSSNGLPASMHIHTDCMIVWFLSTVCFQMSPQNMQKNIGCNSNAVCSIDVFSKCLLWRMDYHTNCTCGLFSTVLLNVSSTCMSGRMQSHTECISLTFLHCAFSNVFSNCLPGTFL